MAESLELWGSPDRATAELGKWFLDEISVVDGVQILPAGRKSQSGFRQAMCVPGIIALAVPSIPGEVLARALAEAGYAVSTGSACGTGGMPKAAAALGLKKDVGRGMIRISLGATSTRSELQDFLTAFSDVLSTLHR